MLFFNMFFWNCKNVNPIKQCFCKNVNPKKGRFCKNVKAKIS